LVSLEGAENNKMWTCLEKVSHWENAFERYVLLGSFWYVSLLPGHNEVTNFALPHALFLFLYSNFFMVLLV
jgi:hypothetical protein